MFLFIFIDRQMKTKDPGLTCNELSPNLMFCCKQLCFLSVGAKCFNFATFSKNFVVVLTSLFCPAFCLRYTNIYLTLVYNNIVVYNSII